MDSTHHYDDCPAKPEVENLKDWQERQNGHLGRIEKKVDRLLYWLLGSMGSVIAVLFAFLFTN